MKQIVVRIRREAEEKSGEPLSVEELLDLYNNLIHDLEIGQRLPNQRILVRQ